jgi:hypothetical protein
LQKTASSAAEGHSFVRAFITLSATVALRVGQADRRANPKNARIRGCRMALQRALHTQGAQAKIYGYSVGPDTPQFRAALGADAQGVSGSAQWSPAVNYVGEPGFYRTAKDYSAAFKKQFGHVPDYHNACASAAALTFTYGLQSAGSIAPRAVRDALTGLSIKTLFGRIKFYDRGIDVCKPMVVNQIQGDHLVTIYPYRLAIARPIYPAPAWSQTTAEH